MVNTFSFDLLYDVSIDTLNTFVVIYSKEADILYFASLTILTSVSDEPAIVVDPSFPEYYLNELVKNEYFIPADDFYINGEAYKTFILSANFYNDAFLETFFGEKSIFAEENQHILEEVLDSIHKKKKNCSRKQITNEVPIKTVKTKRKKSNLTINKKKPKTSKDLFANLDIDEDSFYGKYRDEIETILDKTYSIPAYPFVTIPDENEYTLNKKRNRIF